MGPMSPVRADPQWAGLCPVKTDKSNQHDHSWSETQGGGGEANETKIHVLSATKTSLQKPQ